MAAVRCRVSSPRGLSRLAAAIFPSPINKSAVLRPSQSGHPLQNDTTEGEGRVILVRGTLGSGKTAFAQQCLRRLTHVVSHSHSQDNETSSLEGEPSFPSPTFLRVCEYPLPGGAPATAFHIDLYRCDSRQDINQLCFSERVFKEGNVAIVEWPERLNALAPDLLPTQFLLVNINSDPGVQSDRSFDFVDLSSDDENAEQPGNSPSLWEPREFELVPVGEHWSHVVEDLRG
jgi:tRNA A37 threonylcarbamoyladenosine biosynthesis protein TsaE